MNRQIETSVTHGAIQQNSTVINPTRGKPFKNLVVDTRLEVQLVNSTGFVRV